MKDEQIKELIETNQVLLQTVQAQTELLTLTYSSLLNLIMNVNHTPEAVEQYVPFVDVMLSIYDQHLGDNQLHSPKLSQFVEQNRHLLVSLKQELSETI